MRGAPAGARAAPPLRDPVLDLLVRLPGVDVGRERRADAGDDHRQEVDGELDVRDERAARHLPEVGPGEDGGPDVGEQGEGEPAEDGAQHRVGAEQLEGDYQPGRADDDERHGDGHQQVQRGADAAEVGRRLDDVADEGADDDRVEDPAREAVADGGEQALAGDLPQLGREIHDHDHHRQDDGGDPEEAEAVFRARAGVGADGGGVVVGRAGDDARAEEAEDAVAPRRFGLLARKLVHAHPRRRDRATLSIGSSARGSVRGGGETILRPG